MPHTPHNSSRPFLKNLVDLFSPIRLISQTWRHQISTSSHSWSRHWGDQRFSCNTDLEEFVTYENIQKLISPYDKCLNHHGNYVEKWLYLHQYNNKCFVGEGYFPDNPYILRSWRLSRTINVTLCAVEGTYEEGGSHNATPSCLPIKKRKDRNWNIISDEENIETKKSKIEHCTLDGCGLTFLHRHQLIQVCGWVITYIKKIRGWNHPCREHT